MQIAQNLWPSQVVAAGRRVDTRATQDPGSRGSVFIRDSRSGAHNTAIDVD
jgi:hypothetical protein